MKKYVVELSREERWGLRELVKKGTVTVLADPVIRSASRTKPGHGSGGTGTLRS